MTTGGDAARSGPPEDPPVVVVRRAVPEDLDVLRASEPAGADVAVRELARQERGESVLLVAWIGARPAGRGELLLTDPPELRNLHVPSELQGCGVGTRLVRAAEAAVARSGGTCLTVGVGLDNDGARRLYERLGFRGTGRETTSTYTYVDHDGEHVVTETDEQLRRSVAPIPVPRLETDRLVLRARSVGEVDVYRALWSERDPRVPPHRRIDLDGRPGLQDLAAGIERDDASSRPGLLAVQRRAEGDVIGYCGLVFHGNGAADEPELAFELLRRVHGVGYATEAGRAVADWAAAVGYERLWATVREWNVASRRVLEKLGFRETGEVERDAVHGDSLLTVVDLSGRLSGPRHDAGQQRR